MAATHRQATEGGRNLATAVDPGWRASMRQAIEAALDACDTAQPRVGLVGWRAATLIETVYEAAASVVIIEDDPNLIDSIEEGLVAADLGKKVQLVSEPPGQARLQQRLDVAVTSATSTWLIDAGEAATMANMAANLVVPNAQVVPRRVCHLFELAVAPTAAATMPFRRPRPIRAGETVAVLSESKHLATHEVTATAGVADKVDDTIIVRALLGGRLSALRLTTLVELADGLVDLANPAGLEPVLLPLREEIDVDAGQAVRIHLRYEPGGGLEDAHASATALPAGQPAATGPDGWAHHDHPVTEEFRQKVGQFVDDLDRRGRGADLDKVVSYTQEPRGDVSRLTAIFWTIDEAFKKPVRELIDGFRQQTAAKLGLTPADEVIYQLMYDVYRDRRAS